MKNVLITGSKGQLGSELFELKDKYSNYNYIFTDVEELDITNPEKLKTFFCKNQIDIIINCAAYTAVDKAETDNENAMLLNNQAVRNLAEISLQNNIFLVHISTDYVFNGEKNSPYLEDDITAPVSYYGMSKLMGEKSLFEVTPNAIVIRTSWLYSAFGNNFVKTIIKHATEKESLKVVYDQVGNPTYAKDLAIAILEILPKLESRNFKGIYNFSDEGVASWFDFAKAIVDYAQINCIIYPILSSEFKTITKRPNYSVLAKEKIKADFQIQIPYWHDSMQDCIERLKSK